jgi:uncharacterized protein
MPNLHVIAAGSLLEFALTEIPSFGVGRVRSLFMYPFQFDEFLIAHNEEKLLDILQKANSKNSIPDVLHLKLKDYLKKFMIIGGMPEAVVTYIYTQDLLAVQRVLVDLYISIQADFVKYKTHLSSIKISEVFNAIIRQIGNKF